MNDVKKPEISLNLGKYNAGDRIMISNEFAKYEQYIDELNAEHKRELAEKDKTISYFARTAEIATDRKKQAIRSADRRARLNLSYAVLMIVGMLIIPWALWLIDLAMKSFFLWTQGR